MPVIVTKTTITPDNVPFFVDSSLENAALAAELNAWVETLPGFISVTRNLIDINTKVTVTTWDTIENYNSAVLAKSTRNEQEAKRAYKLANKVTHSFSVTIT